MNPAGSCVTCQRSRASRLVSVGASPAALGGRCGAVLIPTAGSRERIGANGLKADC